MAGIKLLLVCLGNICRSPTAHAVLRHKAKVHKLDISIDSAGTSASHRGELPDNRSIRAGNARGYDFKGLYSRPVYEQDFAEFDLILAMDKDNLAELTRRCPAEYHNKLKLFLTFHPQYPAIAEVPDPYYSGIQGFEVVLNLIEEASEQLLTALR